MNQRIGGIASLPWRFQRESLVVMRDAVHYDLRAMAEQASRNASARTLKIS
jgi:hypothetical protein